MARIKDETISEANSPGGGRMAAEQRRQQILGVAIELFAQRGFSGTTTKEIAQAAGVSEAIIFRHFATKEDLYSAIIDVCAFSNVLDPVEVINEALKTGDDHVVFHALAIMVLNFHDQNPQFQRLLLHSALERHQLAEMFWERTVTPTYQLLGNYIRQRQKDGAFRQMDPMIVVRAFMGMLIHHSINNNLWTNSRGLLSISNEEASREFTEILLRGIGPINS